MRERIPEWPLPRDKRIDGGVKIRVAAKFVMTEHKFFRMGKIRDEK